MNKVGKQVLGSVTRISIMDHYISEVGRGKSFFDVNFGVNMKHVLKVVDTGILDTDFASQLCDALGDDSGVKAKASNELILDRKLQHKGKRAAFPGLKKCSIPNTSTTKTGSFWLW